MKKIVSFSAAWVLLLLLVMFAPANLMPLRADAATALLPKGEDNLEVGLKSTSELVATKDGYVRVFYDGSKVQIENYDASFQIKSKKTLNMELNLWGGFYAGSNSYYLVEGQVNTAEKDSAEVIRVIRYDTSWNRKGAAKITGNADLFGGEVRYPFDYGCVEMTEYNGKLYVVTGHEGYVDPEYNQGHQGFLMIEVDEATMTGEIVDCDLWHSFAQYIANKGSDLYVLEQSEGSRYTKLSRYKAGGSYASDSISVLDYGGSHTSAWAIPCYATVDGIALSDKNVLCLGTSIDQNKYDSVNYDTSYNIYLTVTPMSDFTQKATKVKWLTDYIDDGKRFEGTKITKISDDRFMISWEEYDTSKKASTSDLLSGHVLHYLFINGSGEKLTKEFTAAAPISDCQPIVKNSKVIYYASNSNMLNFYTIDANTGAFSKKSYRIAGDNASWAYKNGTLTISGTGAISAGNSDYSSTWEALSDYVTKIVISNGITSIPDRAFTYFDKLAEVNIAPGVKSIGKEAFAFNMELRKITIPDSVTKIGEDALWTGYYWVGDDSHVYYATIYAPEGSYAQTYAKKNDISFENEISALKGLKLKGRSGNALRIAWTKNTTADGYIIEMKSGGKWTRIGKISNNSTTEFRKAGLKAGTAYSFRVKAYKMEGSIAYYSGYASISARTNPSVVTGLELKGRGAGALRIAWNKNTSADGYVIEMKSGSKWTTVGKISNNSTTEFRKTGLKAGTKYSFRVKAYKMSGKTALYSAYTTISVRTNPSEVSDLKLKASAKNAVRLSWTKNTSADGYIIEMKSGNSWVRVGKVTNNSTVVFKMSGLKPNTSYAFRVKTYKMSGKTALYSGYKTITVKTK